MAKIFLQLVVLCAAFWRIDAIKPIHLFGGGHHLPEINLPSLVGQITCGANEMFSHCGNNGCQASCTRLDVTNCVPTCSIPGCVCVAGYVRNNNGACVLPSQCTTSQVCGTNEVYSACGNDGCRPTCARRDTTGCNPICSSPACVCAAGYVRNNFGNCVLREQCPFVNCPANEIFSNCGNDGCQPTCTRPIVGVCNRVCTVSGCICAPGLIRNEATGQCVTSCPNSPCTGANEVFSQTGDNGCLPSCSRRDVTNCIPVPSNPRCICAAGFVLSPTGTCIDPNTCPTNVCANPNEVFTNTGNTICQPICEVTPAADCAMTVAPRPGCICATGYRRNYLGLCVLEANCRLCTNPTTETFQACGPGVCEGTCATQSPTCNTSGACRGRCFCNTGLVRNNAGLCVAPATCGAQP